MVDHRDRDGSSRKPIYNDPQSSRTPTSAPAENGNKANDSEQVNQEGVQIDTDHVNNSVESPSFVYKRDPHSVVFGDAGSDTPVEKHRKREDGEAINHTVKQELDNVSVCSVKMHKAEPPNPPEPTLQKRRVYHDCFDDDDGSSRKRNQPFSKRPTIDDD